MKILFVVNVDWFFCSHRLPVALGALRNGGEVHVATTITDSRFRQIILAHGLILHELNIDRSGKSFVSFLTSFVSIYRICFLLKPDIVHLVTIQPVLIGGIAANAAGAKRIVFAISGLGHAFVVNSFLSRVRRFLVKALYRAALSVSHRAVIFQNLEDQSRLSRLCSLSPPECYLFPGSGVDLSFFAFKPLQDAQPIVLMASRLLATKGVREFVEAATALKRRGLHVRFQLVGDPDFSNPAAIPAHELALWHDQGHVEVLGHRSDLQDLICRAHVVCLPSYYPEGLPKVLCEAAACGRAVVTTDEPGCRDAIEDGVTGLLVPSRNVPALTTAIEHLLANPDLVRSMGLAGRRRAEQLFDVNSIVDRHLDLYSILLLNS